jgi:hypothetical protein
MLVGRFGQCQNPLWFVIKEFSFHVLPMHDDILHISIRLQSLVWNSNIWTLCSMMIRHCGNLSNFPLIFFVTYFLTSRIHWQRENMFSLRRTDFDLANMTFPIKKVPLNDVDAYKITLTFSIWKRKKGKINK